MNQPSKSPPVAAYLVRHGEVHNPGHVVYADLAGFGLSGRGVAQAAAASRQLAAVPIDVVVSSPLERAVATAAAIAAPHGLDVKLDGRLTEWEMGAGWAGLRWEDLPVLRPGEVEAYLADPGRLDFTAESLNDLAARMLAALGDRTATNRVAVFVSHQDPVQALRRRATGASFDDFHHNKPGHASVTTLTDEVGDGRYTETGYWQPDQGHSLPPLQTKWPPLPDQGP